MHPLDLFDRARRAVFRLLPFRTAWERTAQEVAPDRHEDWLLEPLSREEACCLYPHLEPDEAVLHYQRLRLEMRECDGRGF